jgi:hypothetical protein
MYIIKVDDQGLKPRRKTKQKTLFLYLETHTEKADHCSDTDV